LKEIVERLRGRGATLGVIGLGYVGLPLAVAFGKAGFRVIGCDLDEQKVAALRRGESYIIDVPAADVAELVSTGRLEATTETSRLGEADSVNICVPTPLSKTRDPDISFIQTAVQAILPALHRGMLIILESTTYPGTTEEVILPRLAESGLEVGVDFFLAFSPERVDPGNPQYHTTNIPKVVGGVTPACTEVAKTLYEQVMETVVPVSSVRVAETVKLLENTFRSVNIGLVNEIALMCSAMEIDVWEVIDGAATKPFGFMPFYPGPGLGGHCIPIDPFYLSWKAKLAGSEARFIELAGQVNGSMPRHVVGLVADALNAIGKPVRGSGILVVGVAYKNGIDDIRESPALDIIELLRHRGGDVHWYDPHVEALPDVLGAPRLEAWTRDELARFDAAVIVTAHKSVDHGLLLTADLQVIDTRNALRGQRSERLFRL
jgi:UDP-N-acetyl-D-glucosamine dehydrogenase